MFEPRLRAALRARASLPCGTALVVAGFAFLALLLVVATAPVFAQGGSGQGGVPGGTDSATGAGGTGGAGVDDGGIAGGGGGGGAGVTGGTGGSGEFGGAGGPGGTTPGASGTMGVSATHGAQGGGGGGGGAHGAVVTVSGALTNATGGAGGPGGNAPPIPGAGGAGGGGAGGYGTVVNGTNLSVTNTATITGGVGGAGGIVVDSGTSGGGGSGGIGLDFATSGDTLQNSGTITGGNGGAAGVNSSGNCCVGAPGAGGTGIAGSDLIIINSGAINGGVSGAVSPVQANAITFTGGANTLTTNGGTYTGGFDVTGTLMLNQTATAGATGSATYSTIISGTGALSVVTDSGKFVTLSGANIYSGGTMLTGGTLVVGASSSGSPGSVTSGPLGTGTLTFNGGTLQAGGAYTVANAATIHSSITGTIDNKGFGFTYSGAIGGAGDLTIANSGTGGSVTLSNSGNAYTGSTTINSGATLALLNSGTIASSSGVADGGTFDISGLGAGTPIVSLSGSGALTLGGNTLTLSSASGTFSGTSTGSGGLTLTTGTETISSSQGYTGATTINGGTLNVTGSISTSSLTTVNNTGTLIGTGAVGNTTVAGGGRLAPGPSSGVGTLTVTGNLVLQSAATYMVSINGATSGFANVSGTATLTGATFAAAAGSAGTLGAKDLVLQSGAAISTRFANSQVSFGGNVVGRLDYTTNPNDVYLDVNYNSFIPLLPPGAPQNVVNVANGVDNFLNGGGTLPASFSNLFSLSGTQLQNALTQLDGEAATDAERGAFELMNQFLGLMLDPFVDGRFGTSGAGPIGFAPDQQASFPPDIALAYASVLKAPPAQTFDQRWTAWGSGFGASSTTNGNAAIGSNNVTATDYGFAGGMDYHVTPSTLYGFALAGAGTNWGLAQGLGTGRSDAFQAGVYSKSYWGPAYVAAALAFTNNWFSTNRTALGDDITARFAGQSYGGRLEAGYRYAVPMVGAAGVTPYAAIQTQWFHTPTYSETDLAGGGLGLTYNAMTANDTRSELGARFDDPTLLNGMPLILRARFAWAHDWVSNPALDAVFQSLPGSSFVVNGATPPKDSALASAGAQYFLSPAWSFTAKFDGEFAASSQTYGGTGTLRYTW